VLKEISLVIFGANALAAVAAVKEETPQSPLKPLLQWLWPFEEQGMSKAITGLALIAVGLVAGEPVW
jgi:hypothetical protein